MLTTYQTAKSLPDNTTVCQVKCSVLHFMSKSNFSFRGVFDFFVHVFTKLKLLINCHLKYAGYSALNYLFSSCDSYFSGDENPTLRERTGNDITILKERCRYMRESFFEKNSLVFSWNFFVYEIYSENEA
jgi:hypothetical protein